MNFRQLDNEHVAQAWERMKTFELPHTWQAPIDPHDVPLNSLVSQEKVDVNFISRNKFNNNAYRSNFGRNPTPFPSNNYGNNNTYPSTKNSTTELESMLKDFISRKKPSI